jgi:DNA polymerase elongation subunit (family B)
MSASTTNQAKILFVDIETAPTTAYVWRMWKENIRPAQVQDYSWIMLIAAKWAHEDEVMCYRAEGLEDDMGLVDWAHSLLDEADIVVAHNGNGFDLPIMKTRMIKYKMKPPAPYKSVDTLKAARRVFRFPHNSLEGLGDYLNLEVKKNPQGFSLWTNCLKSMNNPAWAQMAEYCSGDVLAMEKLYERLLPWIPGHPNLGLFADAQKPICGNCGSKRMQRRGTYPTLTQVYPRYHCQKCGKWGRGKGTLTPRSEQPGVMGSVALH